MHSQIVTVASSKFWPVGYFYPDYWTYNVSVDRGTEIAANMQNITIIL